ncbi:hypothetical protein PU560_11495, partial [Georgenia sp. 10Sc9-8]|nr:hypothetical protein [Georgenia halotolerans]
AALDPATTGTTLDFAVAACVGAGEQPGVRDVRARLAPDLAVLAERLCGPLVGRVYPVGEDPVSLDALGLSALSLAYLAAPGTDAVGRVIAYARTVLNLAEDAVLELDGAAHATLWAAGRVAALLREARPLTVEDLPEEAKVDPETAEDARRRDAAATVLQDLRDEVPGAAEATPADAARLFAAGLLPAPEVALVPEAAAALRARLDAAAGTTDPLPATQELLADMPAAPVLRPADPAPWADGPRLRGATPAELTVWLEESQAVRSRLEPLADLLLGSPPVPAQAAQWPGTLRPTRHQQVDWIGAELREDDVYPARSSVVTVGTDLTGAGPFSGLLLDSWQEVVPDGTVTAGVVVDSPSPPARSPHLMVLAVPPAEGAEWSPQALVDTLEHTVATAQARTVGLGSLPATTPQNGVLGRLGHLLPLGAVRPTDTALTRAACEPTRKG